MNLKNSYISDLLKNYPCANDFFETFGLKLNSKEIRLNSYLESINKNFFHEIGIEKKQLLEHFEYFIICTEKLKRAAFSN